MTEMRLTVIYFAYINAERQWGKLITAQLQDLNSSGLAGKASVRIVLTAENGKLLNQATRVVKKLMPRARIHRFLGNNYEYHGIRLVWDIARQVPDPSNHLILYHHSKGMVNNRVGDVRTSQNLLLTKTVVLPWRQIVQRFVTTPKLMKAGYASSRQGFMWFNFWWVRASYAKNLVKPLLTDNRYYYELWLAFYKNCQDYEQNEYYLQCCRVTIKDPKPWNKIFSGAIDCLSLCPENTQAKLDFSTSITDVNKLPSLKGK